MKWSCIVKCASWIVDEDASTVTRPRQEDRRVRKAGTLFGSVDPISAAKA